MRAGGLARRRPYGLVLHLRWRHPDHAESASSVTTASAAATAGAAAALPATSHAPADHFASPAAHAACSAADDSTAAGATACVATAAGRAAIPAATADGATAVTATLLRRRGRNRLSHLPRRLWMGAVWAAGLRLLRLGRVLQCVDVGIRPARGALLRVRRRHVQCPSSTAAAASAGAAELAAAQHPATLAFPVATASVCTAAFDTATAAAALAAAAALLTARATAAATSRPALLRSCLRGRPVPSEDGWIRLGQRRSAGLRLLRGGQRPLHAVCVASRRAE